MTLGTIAGKDGFDLSPIAKDISSADGDLTEAAIGLGHTGSAIATRSGLSKTFTMMGATKCQEAISNHGKAVPERSSATPTSSTGTAHPASGALRHSTKIKAGALLALFKQVDVDGTGSVDVFQLGDVIMRKDHTNGVLNCSSGSQLNDRSDVEHEHTLSIDVEMFESLFTKLVGEDGDTSNVVKLVATLSQPWQSKLNSVQRLYEESRDRVTELERALHDQETKHKLSTSMTMNEADSSMYIATEQIEAVTMELSRLRRKTSLKDRKLTAVQEVFICWCTSTAILCIQYFGCDINHICGTSGLCITMINTMIMAITTIVFGTLNVLKEKRRLSVEVEELRAVVDRQAAQIQATSGMKTKLAAEVDEYKSELADMAKHR